MELSPSVVLTPSSESIPTPSPESTPTPSPESTPTLSPESTPSRRRRIRRVSTDDFPDDSLSTRESYRRSYRRNVTNETETAAALNLESAVRSKLEANIPNGHLTIAASEDGTVTVSGTVTNKDELGKIDTLPKQIKGVTKIVNKATVAPQ
ncbi:MAG: BON domain-containing protein [Brasilonema angustatum HA4187-MV1]|nr:BON domain-containing protein [Brasilonema angustatum HA4187-MV1]